MNIVLWGCVNSGQYQARGKEIAHIVPTQKHPSHTEHQPVGNTAGSRTTRSERLRSTTNPHSRHHKSDNCNGYTENITHDPGSSPETIGCLMDQLPKRHGEQHKSYPHSESLSTIFQSQGWITISQKEWSIALGKQMVENHTTEATTENPDL